MGSFEDRKIVGTVFNIQKYSVHDGPGIRTIVFLKGCPLRCEWCSNPESQKMEPELAVNKGRCIDVSKCGHCLTVCPHNAITVVDDKPEINRLLCGDCPHLCADACPAQGIIVYGFKRNVDEVIKTVEQDALFYSRSGGGMTLSGGEPLMQSVFALALLREARHRRINTAIETCGQVPYEVLKEACASLNTVLFDIKTMDVIKHKTHVGGDLSKILENFENMATDFPSLDILVRTPVVPGFNDTPEDIVAIATFAKRFPQVTYEPLPYHRLGTQKYTFLGRECSMGDVSLPDAQFKVILDAIKSI